MSRMQQLLVMVGLLLLPATLSAQAAMSTPGGVSGPPGFGHSITRDEIERSQARHFSDLLRTVPGVDLFCAGITETCQAVVRAAPATASMDMRTAWAPGGGPACPVQYYVDNVYQPYNDVNVLRPDEIEAVKIYAHGHQAPARFSMRWARCGVVLVWLRTGAR